MYKKPISRFMMNHVTSACLLPGRPLKNVSEAADARQKPQFILNNKHFESVFNTAAAIQIVFQQPARII